VSSLGWARSARSTKGNSSAQVGVGVRQTLHLLPEGYRDLEAADLQVASGGLEREDGSDGTRSEPAALKYAAWNW
jgi:hypothetical protein